MNLARSRVVERWLFVTAVVLLGRWCYIEVSSRQFQARAAQRVEIVGLSPFGTVQVDAPSTRTRALSQRTGIVGELEIPAARLMAVVAEGVDARTLDQAIGHLPGTAMPGEGGHVALAAHRDTFFRRLGRVRPGDIIRFRTPDGAFEYRVTRLGVVSPDRTDVIQHSALTLITCYPFDAIGPAPRRFIVHAEPTGKVRMAYRFTPEPTATAMVTTP